MTCDIRDRNLPCKAAAYQLVRLGSDFLASAHCLRFVPHSALLNPRSPVIASTAPRPRLVQPNPIPPDHQPPLPLSTLPPPMITHASSGVPLSRRAQTGGIDECSVTLSSWRPHWLGSSLSSYRVRAWLIRVPQIFDAGALAGMRTSRRDGISGLR